MVLDDFKSDYIKEISKINWDHYFKKLDLCLIIVTRENQIDLSSKIFKQKSIFSLKPFDDKKDSLDFILAILVKDIEDKIDSIIEVPSFNKENYLFQKMIEKCKGYPKLLFNKDREIEKIVKNLKSTHHKSFRRKKLKNHKKK